MAQRITVKSPDSTYDIRIEHGLLQRVAGLLAEMKFSGKIVVASDVTVAGLYGKTLVDTLPDAALITMPAGEQHKNLDTVRAMYTQMIEARADRRTLMLVLGGGVPGDTAGFVAATYMRGIDFVQAPTTLLAMVDSSVGGKVGVDLPEGKNLVGAFKQPRSVWIDTSVLQTLPPEQWRCGMAEVIKHGLIKDRTLLDEHLWQPQHAEELVSRAVKVKVSVVEEDPFEHGIRAHLNLGHTFAHAIEQVSSYEWMHGDAVGFGLLAAATLSKRLNLCDESLVELVRDTLRKLALPSTISGLDADAIIDAMHTDKKWKNGRSHFVLLKDVGEPLVVQDVDLDVVRSVLESLTVTS